MIYAVLEYVSGPYRPARWARHFRKSDVPRGERPIEMRARDRDRKARRGAAAANPRSPWRFR